MRSAAELGMLCMFFSCRGDSNGSWLRIVRSLMLLLVMLPVLLLLKMNLVVFGTLLLKMLSISATREPAAQRFQSELFNHLADNSLQPLATSNTQLCSALATGKEEQRAPRARTKELKPLYCRKPAFFAKTMIVDTPGMFGLYAIE